MDFSGMSLIKLKTEEMESQVMHPRFLLDFWHSCITKTHNSTITFICSIRTCQWCEFVQVKVLELENQLSTERQRLGELRKKHYELAGVPLDQTVERDFDGFVSVLPPVMPEPPLPEPPKLEPPKNPPSKKPSIFQKSGSLLRNKVPILCTSARLLPLAMMILLHLCWICWLILFFFLLFYSLGEAFAKNVQWKRPSELNISDFLKKFLYI